MILVMALGLIVGLGATALAHFVYEKTEVWQSSTQGRCVVNRSEVSHGGGGGYTKVSNITYNNLNTPGGAWDCTDTWELGGKYKRNKYHFLKWSSPDNKWKLCKYSEWAYNKTSTYSYSIAWDFGSTPPCGAGAYATHGHVENRINRANNQHDWVGGPMWSGSHSLPAS
jgi:hypothetical protein